MTKESKYQRRKRLKREKAWDNGLTLTVAASPSSRKVDGSISLANELQLVKSALLYADKVQLISPMTYMLQSFEPLRKFSEHTIWFDLREAPDIVLRRLGIEDEGATLAEFRKKAADFARAPKNDPRYIEGTRLWAKHLSDALEEIEHVRNRADVPELETAIEEGAITLSAMNTEFEDPVDRQVNDYRAKIEAAFADPAGTVMLDTLTAADMRAHTNLATTMTEAANSRSTRATTGSRLISHLPVFPDSSMEDVLQARRDLSDDRRKYRNTVRDLTEKIKSSTLDESLPSDIDELWHDLVKPTLDDMKESVSAMKIAGNTGHALVTGVGPNITLSVGTVASVAAWAGIPEAAFAAGSAVATNSVVEAFRQVLQARRERRQHDLYHLLNLNSKLK